MVYFGLVAPCVSTLDWWHHVLVLWTGGTMCGVLWTGGTMCGVLWTGGTMC